MTLTELAPALKDAAGIEIQQGKRYLIFMDACAVSAKDIERALQDPIDADIQVIFLHPAPDQPITERIAAFQLEPVAEHDAGGMSIEGEEE